MFFNFHCFKLTTAKWKGDKLTPHQDRDPAIDYREL